MLFCPSYYFTFFVVFFLSFFFVPAFIKNVFLQGQVVEQLSYFSRIPGAIITAEMFDVAVQFGTVRGDPTQRLLHDMTCLHAPPVALSNYRERSIKHNYSNNMHSYLASLTGGLNSEGKSYIMLVWKINKNTHTKNSSTNICNEVFLDVTDFFFFFKTDDVYRKVGKTVLYIPLEGLQCSPEEASQDKELVQRMECKPLPSVLSSIRPYVLDLLSQSLLLSVSAVVIYWTDQIKDVLHGQEIMKVWDSCGPLQEIEFWKSRCVKLRDITQQLQKPGVRHIQSILELCKSLYVQRFCKLSKEIQVLEASDM